MSVYRSVPYMLVFFEFVTAAGFLVVFYFLFGELKKILGVQKYQMIKYRTATYLALISILQASRFFYFGIVSVTMAMENSNHRQLMISCQDLIPSYVTEIFFCLFVSYHIFTEGQTTQQKRQSNGTSSGNRRLPQS